jgi:hypothetical protein
MYTVLGRGAIRPFPTAGVLYNDIFAVMWYGI